MTSVFLQEGKKMKHCIRVFLFPGRQTGAGKNLWGARGRSGADCALTCLVVEPCSSTSD